MFVPTGRGGTTAGSLLGEREKKSGDNGQECPKQTGQLLFKIKAPFAVKYNRLLLTVS